MENKQIKINYLQYWLANEKKRARKKKKNASICFYTVGGASSFNIFILFGVVDVDGKKSLGGVTWWFNWGCMDFDCKSQINLVFRK